MLSKYVEMGKVKGGIFWLSNSEFDSSSHKNCYLFMFSISDDLAEAFVGK